MKKWKILISVFVLVVAAGAGTLYYFLDVKQYNTKDTKVDKIVKSDYQIKLPGDNTSSQGNNGGVKQSANSGSKQTGTSQTASSTNQTAASIQTGKSNNVNSAHSNSGNTSGTREIVSAKSSKKSETKISASAILAQYQPVFKDLENQANGKINTLLSYALNEYSAEKATGGNISYFYFYDKYNAAGMEIESETDASFNYIYNALVSDLKKNGYSASLADPIKEQYKTMKSARRSALLKKAISHFS